MVNNNNNNNNNSHLAEMHETIKQIDRLFLGKILMKYTVLSLFEH